MIRTRLEAPTEPVYENGVEIALRDRLAEGGEGSVHPLRDGRKLVAKLYKKEDGPSLPVKTAKLKRLTAMQSERLRQAAAWPVSMVTDSSNQPVGFLMEYLDNWAPLYAVYQLKSRTRLMPGRDWAFLVRVARNLATCVHFVHDAGLVIGDLNESNVLVHPNAMVKLIDVDSFQVPVEGEVLTVDVGKAELTPPELQGKSLEGRVRTANEDCFALAVLVFHLLVFGRHPYAGRPAGDAEITLEACIESGYYAYTNRRRVPVKPPPHLDISWLPGTIRELFESAFERRADRRPTAFEWYLALKDLESSLTECSTSPLHKHWSELKRCPWCDLESRWHIPLFSTLSMMPTTEEIDTESIWAEIEAVPAPVAAHFPVPFVAPDGFKPSLTFRAAAVFSRFGQFFFYLWVVWLQLAYYARGALAVCAAVYAAMQVFIWGSGFRKRYKELDELVKKSTEHLDGLRDRWKNRADSSLFLAKKHELESIRDRFRNISGRYNELRYAELRRRYMPQLESFLKKFSVEVADISWITKDQLDDLLRNGIHTAADLTRAKLAPRYRNSESMVEALLTWRDALENHYWNTTNFDLSAQTERTIQRQLAAEKQKLRTILERGKAELAGLTKEIEAQQVEIATEASAAYDELGLSLAEWETYQRLLGKQVHKP
jgi:DNA-binding helix-hairpin-helix protein with protein kinase domain